VKNLAELQNTVTSLGKAVAAVNLLMSDDPADAELAAVHQSVQDAHSQLCGRLQTALTEAHLQDLKNRTAAELTQPRDPNWERVRR
jgi:hypothetical protein